MRLDIRTVARVVGGRLAPEGAAAVVTGILWELAKYAYVLALPWLNFQDVYGPFSISVTLMFWAFLSGLLLLGGARHASAPPRREIELLASGPGDSLGLDVARERSWAIQAPLPTADSV